MDGWCCILIQDAENDRLSREARGDEIQRRIDQLYSTVTHPKSIAPRCVSFEFFAFNTKLSEMAMLALKDLQPSRVFLN